MMFPHIPQRHILRQLDLQQAGRRTGEQDLPAIRSGHDPLDTGQYQIADILTLLVELCRPGMERRTKGVADNSEHISLLVLNDTTQDTPMPVSYCLQYR
jgi:hypothetical protein